MLVYKDGVVKHYKEMFPSISFPSSGPTDQWMSAHGVLKVSLFKSHTSTQKLVPSEPYVEGGFAYTVRVENKTQEEVSAELASKSAKMRAQRDRLLSESDWTQVADAPVDKAAWATYRQALRDLPNQEGFPDVAFPNNPDQVALA
jgi:hypothetical protein